MKYFIIDIFESLKLKEKHNQAAKNAMDANILKTKSFSSRILRFSRTINSLSSALKSKF